MNDKHEVKIITFGDTKTIINRDGQEEEVNAFIPTCCREGHDDCPHVVNRDPIKKKRNIAL